MFIFWVLYLCTQKQCEVIYTGIQKAANTFSSKVSGVFSLEILYSGYKTFYCFWQAVRVDPWDGLGSLSHPLGDGGAVVALACHPYRPIVAACLSDRTIVLWDYQGVYGQDTTRFSVGSAGGGGGEVAGGEGFMGGAGGGSGMGSPTFSPPKGVRGSSKAGRDEK